MADKTGERMELVQGTLDMIVMRTLLIGPANGYEIARAIERLSEDVFEIDHGSLYPPSTGWRRTGSSPASGKHLRHRRARF